jgi:hypothetical protein
MSDEEITREVHERLAKSLFNSTWDLLEKKDRTEDDEVAMIRPYTTPSCASRHARRTTLRTSTSPSPTRPWPGPTP